ncbi:phage tail spike protein [Mammaliicoccus sciuri]|uniref:phage tail spike protein n=1 Tax=Mammaliicoccus sciuri TaxID=1296 RepID=UPI002DBB8845|nr:phage tail spike protein [Mammaliicoccus sciuri]MEB5757396.1 hypothetical protein [Mammaliicoccus sciuri]
MIHVLNFEGNIIDFISNNDNAIIHAKHNRDINERTETYDLTILSDRATHFLNKNRVIIQDSNKRYREFIIDHIESSEDGYTEIEMSASYLTDIATAKPLAPNKLDKMTTSQALDDVLKDTGWQRSGETEYGGVRTTSWTSYQTKYEVLLQLCTTYDMSLDFYIELGSNKVKGRYVSLKVKNPLFKGKEIVKGKDLLNLKRTVDLNEVKTALLCVGPEKDDGTRLELVVTDDEAQEQFGLPQRYLWGIYEPESEDSSMTETRLRSLGTTELNKRKVATISYEVSAIDIKKENPHEIVNLGDLVRIKDRDFNPPLYIEAEVIGEEYDPISEDSTYTFGQFKEYNESDLRAEFNKKLSSIQKKLVDSINNVNTIIRDTLDDELQYYEQKIIKSDTPPENPVNDMLWYDTSNPEVAVLWRYWNGEWREHSVNDVEKIGGITREKALFSELNNTFINLSIQHSKLLSDVYEVINSEYLVDTDLKNEVNTKLNDTIGVFNQIKTNLDSMTPETATIGKLIDTQTLYLTYRERIQALYTTLETAKIAIDDRFKMLQAQYTEEKFNEAMQKVADKFGFEYNENGFLVGDGTLISGAIQALREDTEEQFKSVVKSVDYDVDMNNVVGRLSTADTERLQLANEINDRVTLAEYQNMKVGTRNLLMDSKIRSNKSGTPNYYYIRYQLTKPLIIGKEYTLSFVNKIITGDNLGETSIMGYTPNTTRFKIPVNNNNITNFTFTANAESSYLLIYTGVAGTQENELTTIEVTNAMLVEGNKIGDYEEAPEDRDKKLTTMQTQISQNGTDINARATKEEFNASKKTLSRVLADLTINTTDGLTLSYDENGAITSHVVGPDGIKLKGDKVDIQANSEFNVLVGNVNDKVGKDEIINRLNLSPEGLDINVNNVGIRGGDAINYISIRNNEMLSYGVFERSWAGEKDTAKLELGIKDGRIMVRNQTTGYRLYLTERGLSTMMDGYSEDTSGTLEFHSQRFNETSRGITMHSTYGAVAMLSEQSRAYIRSNLTANIESFSYGVYIRPYVSTRKGVNEFNFYVKDADSESGTDGAILFGEISDDAGLAGSGIRFKKNAARGYANMESVVYATDNSGAIGTGSFYADKLYGDWKAKTSNLYAMVNGEFRVTDFNGATGTNGSINYAPVRIGEINSYGSYANHSGNNVYFGVGLNELRITNNNHYNRGNISYKPIRASDYLPGSLERFKRDIELWQGDALSEIRDNMTTYSYYLNDDDDERKKRKGLIIGDNYKTPDDFIDGDGVSLYNMITYSLRAIQQLDEQNQKLENKIKTLEEKYNE